MAADVTVFAICSITQVAGLSRCCHSLPECTASVTRSRSLMMLAHLTAMIYCGADRVTVAFVVCTACEGLCMRAVARGFEVAPDLALKSPRICLTLFNSVNEGEIVCDVWKLLQICA